MPFQFGDETLKSQIGTNPKPILVSECTIPKLGDSFDAHPHFGSGIPVLVWGFEDPRFGYVRHHLMEDRFWYAFGVVHYRARAHGRPFIIYEIIYAACWGVGLPFHHDAKIHMSHN